jgi:hypothetical protein
MKGERERECVGEGGDGPRQAERPARGGGGVLGLFSFYFV